MRNSVTKDPVEGRQVGAAHDFDAIRICIYSARVALRTTSLVDLGQIFFSQLQEFADTIFRSIQTLEFERVHVLCMTFIEAGKSSA